MSRRTNPYDLMKLGIDSWRMMVEAQTVVGLRLWGMSGGWRMAPGETSRMIAEKQSAFAQSAFKAMTATAAGAPADRILAAALRPVGRKTAGNSKRLTRSVWRQKTRR